MHDERSQAEDPPAVDPSTPTGGLPAPVTIESADGTRIATYDLGGPGDDLVLVHATGFCAGVWLPLARHLRAHRLVTLDVRGHGRSAIPDAGMHWSGTAEDVLATVDALDLVRPFGVGHSMGGASLLLAEQSRPGTFRGLWLYEPIVFPPDVGAASTGSNPLAEGARRRRADFDSSEAAYANFAAKAPLSQLAPEALSAYVEHGFETLPDGSITLRCRPGTEAETYEMGPRHDAYDRLGEVGCRVTVARGSTEVPGPASVAPLVAERLTRATLEEHPDLGHFGPLEAPAAIAEAIESAVTASS